MFFVLGRSVKRRFVHELKDCFGDHPIYQKIVPFIQQKYVFDERPQYGIVVKAASASPIRLSADHRIGTVISHVMLAPLQDRNAHSVEWVREDIRAVRANGDVFPSPAGVYFVNTLEAPDDTETGRVKGSFSVDEFLTVHDELVLESGSAVLPAGTEGMLAHPPTAGTVFVTFDRRWPAKEGVEYEIDYNTGRLTLLRDLDPHVQLFVDYRWFRQTTGPYEFDWNTANNTAIPGVVLAFGRRVRKDDRQAVVVTSRRVETAAEYGGQTDITLDFDVIARDQDQMGEIADLTFFYLWAQRQYALADDGIVLQDFSITGEVEESYDETEETWYYSTGFSMTVRTDWFIHVPMPLTFRHISYMSVATQDQAALLNDEEAAKLQTALKMDLNLGLTQSNQMTIRGKTWNYESVI